ncbi:Hypothetical predicted protein [Xyrichtys novacula]|uniref:Uncharacterized protein n=1 Tax=Xyrichtys novacula TaxID=13765 RepID=A0AAV1GSR1_XYRNO|nr:Hypothetical predicted protein [Xyrichtys novacula]
MMAAVHSSGAVVLQRDTDTAGGPGRRGRAGIREQEGGGISAGRYVNVLNVRNGKDVHVLAQDINKEQILPHMMACALTCKHTNQV